jgi:hypothetical protein
VSDITALILCVVLVVFFGVPIVFSPFVLGALVIVAKLVLDGPD